MHVCSWLGLHPLRICAHVYTSILPEGVDSVCIHTTGCETHASSRIMVHSPIIRFAAAIRSCTVHVQLQVRVDAVSQACCARLTKKTRHQTYKSRDEENDCILGITFWKFVSLRCELICLCLLFWLRARSLQAMEW